MSDFKQAMSFDDVLLVPRKSDIETRAEVNLTSTIGSLDFKIPIVSAPMDTVTESAMANTMHTAGGLGIVHRYNSIENQCEIVSQSRSKNIGAAIGVSGDFEERACALFDSGANVICVDVAHGHHAMMKSALERLRSVFGSSINIIAGNVATLEAFNDLSDWGADANTSSMRWSWSSHTDYR